MVFLDDPVAHCIICHLVARAFCTIGRSTTLTVNVGDSGHRRSGVTVKHAVINPSDPKNPASRAWEPFNDALLQALSCGQLWSGATLDEALLTPSCGTRVARCTVRGTTQERPCPAALASLALSARLPDQPTLDC